MLIQSRGGLQSVALLMVFAGSSAARALPTACSDEPTLAQRLARLCEDLEQRRQDLHISGLSLAVVKDDQVVLARGFGLRDREQKLAADERTLYGIGSTTKAFTSMVCAMVADEGKLAFTDRPSKHLPWFKFKDPKADAEATLRDLMSHRTGLTRTDLAWIGTPATREQLLRQLAVTDPMTGFRAAWQYNNAMFLTAGECAAAATGRSWDELVAERIFRPLGMVQTVTTAAGALADPKLSRRYDWNTKSNDFEPVEFLSVDNMAPAGSICSTVVDMAQWVRFLLRRGELGGKQLVSDAALSELWKDDDDLNPSYGQGWFLHEKDGQEWRDAQGNRHQVIEHGGNVPGYAAEVGLLPDQHVGLVLLTNTSASQLQAGILPFVFDALLGPWKARRAVVEGKVLAEADTAKWLGSYVEDLGWQSVTNVLTRASDHLTLVLPPRLGQWSTTLYTLLWAGDDGRWFLREEPDSWVTFDRAVDGGLSSIKLVQGQQVRRMTPAVVRDTSTPPNLSLDEFLAKRSEQVGSESAAGWHTVRASGSLQVPQSGIRGSYVIAARGSDQLRIDFDATPFGKSTLIVSGDHGALRANVGSTPVLPAEGLALLRFANPILEAGDWLAAADEVELTKVVRATELGAPLPQLCYQVRVKPNGTNGLVYYAGVNDFRLLAVEGPTAFPGLPSSVPVALLSDFRDVQGVKLPFHREFAAPQLGRMLIQLDQVEVDVELTDDLFELPPPAQPTGS